MKATCLLIVAAVLTMAAPAPKHPDLPPPDCNPCSSSFAPDLPPPDCNPCSPSFAPDLPPPDCNPCSSTLS